MTRLAKCQIKTSGSVIGALGYIALLTIFLASSAVQAAKPGSTTESASSGEPPEIFRAHVDYVARTVNLQGVHLITGSAGSPEFPSLVTFGGEAISIDEVASSTATDFSTNRGPLIIPFDDILVAQGALIIENALPPEMNVAVRVTTAGGLANTSVYFEDSVLAVSSPEPPPSTGSCPCTPLYDQHYKAIYALLWPTCTAPGSSNAFMIVPTEQYIEAQYIDELAVRYVTISSDSSLSSRNGASADFVSTCSVRTDGDAVLAGPLPVSDEDHAACVADIIAREPICRGGNWLDP